MELSYLPALTFILLQAGIASLDDASQSQLCNGLTMWYFEQMQDYSFSLSNVCNHITAQHNYRSSFKVASVESR